MQHGLCVGCITHQTSSCMHEGRAACQSGIRCLRLLFVVACICFITNGARSSRSSALPHLNAVCHQSQEGSSLAEQVVELAHGGQEAQAPSQARAPGHDDQP
jgi:hypothetical protein